MDKDWISQVIGDMAAFVPDQSWDEILKQLVEAMVACNCKLNTEELGSFLAVAAAVQRKGEGKKGWWAL